MFMRLTLSPNLGQKLTMLARERDISVAALVGIMAYEYANAPRVTAPVSAPVEDFVPDVTENGELLNWREDMI